MELDAILTQLKSECRDIRMNYVGYLVKVTPKELTSTLLQRATTLNSFSWARLNSSLPPMRLALIRMKTRRDFQHRAGRSNCQLQYDKALRLRVQPVKR